MKSNNELRELVRFKGAEPAFYTASESSASQVMRRCRFSSEKSSTELLELLETVGGWSSIAQTLRADTPPGRSLHVDY